MSTKDSLFEGDPLILGPQPDLLDRLMKAPDVAGASSFDLESSSPFFDFWKMLSAPGVFFKTLYRLPVDFAAWVWLKAGLLAIVAIWVQSFQSQKKLFELFGDRLFSSVAPEMLSYLEHRAGILQLAPKIKVLSLLLFQFQAAAAPFFAISQLVVGTGFLMLGLRLVGVAWQKISFPKLLLLGIYLEFFRFFALVPVAGSFAVFCLRALFGVWAVSTIFELTTWKSIQACFLMAYAVAQVVALLALVPLLMILKMFA